MDVVSYSALSQNFPYFAVDFFSWEENYWSYDGALWLANSEHIRSLESFKKGQVKFWPDNENWLHERDICSKMNILLNKFRSHG